MSNVSLKVTAPGEGRRTARADERLGCGVPGRAVVLEVVAPEEGQVTEVTAVRSLTCVVAHVPVPVWARGEALPAVLAQVALVGLHAVGLQLHERPEHYPADLTAVSACLCDSCLCAHERCCSM